MRDDSEAIDNDPPVATPEEPSVNPSSIISRLCFFVAAAAVSVAQFASAGAIAHMERQAAVAHLAAAPAASQARVLVAEGAPGRR